MIVEFNALVTNSAGNQQGISLPNDFIVRVDGGPGTDPSPSVTVTVAEPSIGALSKTALPTGRFDAGDRVNYSVQYSNGIGPSDSTAYDVQLVDPLPAAKMTLDLGSVRVFRNGVEITTGFTDNSTSNTVDVSVDVVGRGDTIIVAYDVVLTQNVAAGEQIRNAADVTYTSLPGPNGTVSNPTGSANTGTPGSSTGERNGSGQINDYFVATENLIDILNPFLDKTITDTNVSETTANQFDTGITDLAIGEIVTYNLLITVPEGTTPLVLTDQLPTGAAGEMQIVSSQVLTIGGNITGSLLNPGDAGTTTSPSSVEFDFGTVVNAPDNAETPADLITVQVVAQVLNRPVNVAGKDLVNEATLDYQLDTRTATAVAEVVEPDLEITKEVVGDDSLDANQTVTYQVTLRHTNTSTAIAFNIDVTDTLPDSLELLGGSIVSQPDYSASTSWNPAVVTISGNTVTLTADWLDHPDSPISAGILDEIVFEYTARVKGPPEPDAAAPCDTIVNTATVDYDSYFAPSDTNLDISRPYTADDDAQIAINCNAIQGVIYVDLNNNGIYEPGAGETLITESVTMLLTGTDHLGNAVSRSVTTTTGIYSFDELRPSDAGGYTVTQDNQPAGYVDGKDTPGTPFGGTATQGGDPRDAEAITQIVIPLESNQDGIDYNFGELPPARIADFVWEDLNGNGRQDAGEPGIDGVTVDLAGTDSSGNPVTRTTTTAGGGLYEFADLRPGDYVVTFTPPSPDFVFTTQDSPVADDTTDSDADPGTGATPAITLGIGEDNPTIDAGLYQLINIGDFVWYDINADGVQDPGEPGIPGAT
ncbi:MAG: isopeptide-forming domain-containing fimbrial protein, partial [Planctomycetes bacterium]|nr:isopeptide-forming domain-containing fimbrial protein [Planctomycetota bacterium]